MPSIIATAIERVALIEFLTEKAQRARDGASQRRRLADAFAQATPGELETGRRLLMAHGRIDVNPFTDHGRNSKVEHDRMVAQRLDDEADTLLTIAEVVRTSAKREAYLRAREVELVESLAEEPRGHIHTAYDAQLEEVRAVLTAAGEAAS